MNAFLDDILRGLVTFSTGIFILLGLGFVIYLRKFIKGLREWQGSVFGLEKDLAQRKLISASTGLTLILLLVIGEFLLITFISPRLSLVPSQSASSIDPLASPTTTLSAMVDQTPQPADISGEPQETLESDCIEDVLEITFPADGEQVSGTVELIGSVNVADFGSYKYEFSTTGTVNWVTIAADNQLKLDESLGFWYTSALTPGPYLLSLVPLNNLGEEMTPCIITVEVVPEE
ncbi:MAG: hypothetical protein SVP52_09050 [Chloroflexota bacterium]|nr:hypothetical protein [Chloroflexota bacterium]